jgi:hypothetical protein
MSFTGGDLIDVLPKDENALSVDEQKIADTLFKKQQTTLARVLNKTSDVILAGFLFALFLIPQVDSLIIHIFPSAGTSVYFLGTFKTILFMLLFFTFKNIYLVRT